MRKFNVYFMALAVVLSLCGTAVHAATVTWGAPTTISADTDISISGNSISAFNNGTTGVAGATVNGVAFTAFATPSSPVTVGNATLSATALSGNNALTSVIAPFNSLSANYKTLLSTATTAGANVTITLQFSGLTVGGNYQFQWRVCDTTLITARSTTATAGTSVTLSHNTTNALGGVGQFVAGTFTADAVTQSITFVSTTQTQINSFQLRQLVASDLSMSTPTTATSPIVAGSNIAYTFNALNNTTTAPGNSAPANTVTVTVNMPTSTGGTTGGYVSLSVPAGWTFTAPAVGSTAAIVVTNFTAALVNGTPQGFTLTAKISSAATGTNSQTNTIAYTAASGNTDPSGGNNTTASAASAITLSADLQITETGAASYSAGGNRVVTFTVSNAGPSDSPQVNTFTLPLPPASVTLSNYTHVSGVSELAVFPSNGGNYQVNFPAIPVNSNSVFTLTESASVAVNYTDAPTITPPGSVTDPFPANNTTSLPATVTVSNVTVTTTITPTALPAGAITPAGSYPAGDTGIVALTMTNTTAGSAPASVTSLSATLPANFSIGTIITPQSGFTVSKSGQVVTVTSGTVANGTPVVISIPVSVLSSQAANITLTIPAPTLTLANGGTQSPAPAGASITTSIISDMSVAFSGVSGSTAGLTRSMTVTVTNAGPSNASNVVLVQNAAAGATFTSFTQPGTGPQFISSGSPINTWTIAALAAGATQTFTFTELVNAATTGTLTDSATVTVNGNNATDPTTANNTATSSSIISSSSDVSVAFSGFSGSTAGLTRSMTVTVTNAGPSNAANVVLVQNAAAGATFTSFTQPGTGPQFTPSGSPINTWTIAALAAGATQTFTFTELVNAATTGTLTDSATVTVNGNNATDPTTANNTATSSSIISSSSDVSVAFSGVSGSTAGQTRSMTVTVTNAGPSNASNVVLVQNAAAGATFTSFTQPGTGPQFTPSGSPINTWTIASLAAGATQTFTFTELVNAATTGTLTDTATVTVNGNNATDPTTANNTATSSSIISSSSDVSVAFSSVSGSTAGRTRSMIVTVNNAGPSNAANVVLVQNAATGATFTSFTQPGTGPQFTSSGSPINTWTIASLAAGATQTFTFTELVNAATTGTLTDSATVTVNGNNATDPTIANNTATTSSSISSSADVGIGFSVSPPSPQGIGGNLTYTVQVFNNGPSVAYNVTITDDFLATNTNLSFVSQTPGNVPGIVLIGTPGTNVADTIASLPVGVFTFQIVAQIKQTVAANTVVTNKVTIAASGSTDPVPSNNSGTSPGVTAIVNSDVAVAITNVSPSAPVAGAPLTYTITLTNNGPTNATGVMFSTITPANTTFTSVSASPALTFPTQPIPGATGPIASGATAIAAGSVVTITLTLNVNSNTAKSTNIQLTGSETSTSNDLTAGNNSATSPITSSMTNADVTIPSLSTLSPTVQTPGTITYTFNVVNNGPSDATGIIINDTLPAAATFVSMTQSGSSVVATVNGSNALTYTIPGSISSAAGSNTIPFTITVSIPSSASNLASISNTVSLTVGVGGSTDTNLGNNSASATVAVGSNADLGIAVVVSANPVVGGNVLTYTVTLTNNGPSDAQLPQFSFPIPGPGQVTFNSVTIPNNWTQTSTNNAGDTSGTITATVPTMAAGAPPVVFRLTFTVNPNISSSLVNTPTIFSVAVPSTPDTTLANNSATNFTVATKPQPTVSVNTISVPEGDPGVGSVDYTISLSAANTQVVSVDYATVDGTATNPFDYIQASGTLMFNPGETSKTVSIQIIGDALVEPTKSFTLHVSNPVNTTILANDGVCTILNDDFGGAFGFTAANFVVNESDGTATITVQRPAAATADKTFVSYATSDGSAIAGLDYVATSGVLNFTFGQQTQTFTVKLLNPVAAVAGATVKLTLSNPRSLDAKNNVIVLPGASATLDPNATTSTLTILARPAITSTLLVHTLIGAQFSYTPTATGETPVFYSLGANATLPPGLNFTPGFGYITGVPTKVSVPVDAFKVPIVATNSVGSVMQTLTIVVDANVASGGSNSLLDSDGDGYPDELELAVGSDPLDAMSTPLNIKKLTLTGIKNLKLKINLDFTLLGNDSITLTGIVVMPPDFGQSGKLVYFDIGGVIRRFALDANGLSKVGDDNVKFKIGKPGGDGKSTATFKLSITKGDFQSTSATNPLLKNAFPLLDDEGLTNTTVKAQARVVPVMILLNSSLYNVMQNQVYTSTQGKSGKTSNP